ncbi:zinc finger MYM-type protein 1-like [Gymnodraco acuticeps]|uniref:Zinc finger MYM-type protein 1-like n=1 Tax=Gymnodraco acuticeps TaxID=8218 RepID=A0A6P8W5R4_GYMAC|nr:zinc finger MYM-type protein 1-like [Gymnodraco acuticeps]
MEARWSCQYTALVAIRKSLPAVKATFTEIMSQPNARRKTEARAVSGLIDEQFVLLLTLFEDLSRVTKFMSDQLQSPSLELSSAMDLADSVIATLTDRRSEKSWREIQDRASDLCTKANVNHNETPERRHAQPPRHLQEFVVEAQIERRPVTSLDALRTECFYPVIDRLVVEMRRRFSTEAGGVLSGVSALSPKHASFLDNKCLQPMAKFYGVTEENPTPELHQVKRLLERKKQQGHELKDTAEFLVLMRPYKDAFTDLHRLICTSLTLPVTSAGCERSFFCLRRIKNYLRNSSGDARNSNLGLLAINKQRSKALDVQRVRHFCFQPQQPADHAALRTSIKSSWGKHWRKC